MATVLITGGTGLIGKALTDLLVGKGYRVVVLTRQPVKGMRPFTSGAEADDVLAYALWNVSTGQFPTEVLPHTDYIVHLAGANVAKGRWTKRRKLEIVRSRTQSGALLVETLKKYPGRVKGVISASAIGWYGPDTGKRPFRETDPSADDFLGRTCQAWEDSLAPLPGMGKRLVILRTGIVLARDGGALPAFRAPLKGGIAAIMGGGRQMISWIHLADLCRLYVHAIENPDTEGVYNAVAPEPVSNKALVLALAQQVRGRFFIPVHVPAFVLRAVLGEMSVEVLKSCTADAQRIRNRGFQYTFPTIAPALTDLTATT
jgi:uncharacterized protein (TIGR01777 family)